ncbi:GNAT family N-acetyltransferase [Candidatus Woesearchaeota archaeon]|nr:GNAT family N-acetyltransferase [Candidatus Woesearchaeota archaeon]
MAQKFKEKLIGERIILRKTKPTIEMARLIFHTIDANREHLRPWLPWEKLTKQVEDTLKYLFDKEKETEKGTKVEYGIYVNAEYLGNIGIFNIDLQNKTAEIGYWLSLKSTGKGYITEAIGLIEKEFFQNRGLNRIQIKCDERNTASVHVAQRCGYVLEGKHREDSYSDHFKDFRTTLIFSKLRSEYRPGSRAQKRTLLV